MRPTFGPVPRRRLALTSFFLSRGLPQKGGKRSDQMDEMQEPRIGHADRQELEVQEITNAMVRLYKELFGRGPTKARSNYAGPDTLVATVQNSLTAAESKMLELDEHQRVRGIRMFFQHASSGAHALAACSSWERRNRGSGPTGTAPGAFVQTSATGTSR